jgi:catecholate siderophore receptor
MISMRLDRAELARSSVISLSAALLCLSGPTYAAEGDAEAAGDGREIIVTGRLDGYRTVDTTTGTKTNTAILDVPQAISVVTEQQINDQAIRSMTDLVRLIPGVSSGQGEGHRDQITLRGNNSTADFFVDGLRDDVQYFRGFYNIDRIEVHKGPNAMIFGRGGGGGLVNRVTKGALIGENRVGGMVSSDTFGAWYVSGDVNVDLMGAGLRINGFYEQLNNHRDAYDGERYAVNPVVGAQLGDAIKLQLGYEYVKDSRVVDRGIPSQFTGVAASPETPLRPLSLKAYRDVFFGVRGENQTDFEAHVVRFRGEAKLTDQLTLSAQGQYGSYDKIYSNVYAAAPADLTLAVPTTAVEAYRDPTKRKSAIGQVNLEWRGRAAGMDHVVLAGAEYTSQDSRSERIGGFFDATLNAASRRRMIPLATQPLIPPVTFVAGAAGNNNRAVKSNLSQLSFYLQDQISFSDKLDLIAGLRYDRFDLEATNLFTAAQFARTDDLWSPRVGLVFKPVENASIYLSYSKSFLPQSGDQFVNLDITSEALEPEEFDNYEIGAKWDIKPGLTLTTAVYRLDRTNTRVAGPVPGTLVQTGAQRTSGYEVGLTGRLNDKWQASIGYANTKAEVISTTATAPTGRKIAQVPRHQFSLWNRYDVTKKLGLGLGLYHQSKQFTTISNVVELPSFTRLDLAAFVKLTDQFELQLNVENVTNTRYFPVAHNDNNISTGAPINARLTLNVKL